MCQATQLEKNEANLIWGLLSCLLQGNNNSMERVALSSDHPQQLSFLWAQSWQELCWWVCTREEETLVGRSGRLGPGIWFRRCLRNSRQQWMHNSVNIKWCSGSVTLTEGWDMAKKDTKAVDTLHNLLHNSTHNSRLGKVRTSRGQSACLVSTKIS